jgi:CMP-N-acetylneuraminic acid synthetase
MKFFIIIKEKSERLPNKNFLNLGGKPLYSHLLHELRTRDVYVDTDSESIYTELRNNLTVTCYKRDKKFIDYETDLDYKVSPVLLMIDNFLEKYVDDENEIIITPHVTSPFIKLSTIVDASEYLNKGYDTVQACTEHKEFTYFKDRPVNFDENVVQKTQDLKPVVMGNGAFFIFTKKTFKENNNRTGKNPYFYPITVPESIEIDDADDWYLAERIYEYN